MPARPRLRCIAYLPKRSTTPRELASYNVETAGKPQQCNNHDDQTDTNTEALWCAGAPRLLLPEPPLAAKQTGNFIVEITQQLIKIRRPPLFLLPHCGSFNPIACLPY